MNFVRYRGKVTFVVLASLWLIGVRLYNRPLFDLCWNFTTDGYIKPVLALWAVPIMLMDTYKLQSLASSVILILAILADDKASGTRTF